MAVVAVGGPDSQVATALTASAIDLLVRTDDVDTAVTAVVAHVPQVVVVDMATPGLDALDAIGRFAGVPVLAVSGSAEHGAVLAAVRAGAAGYLVGPVSMLRLTDAVRRMAAGEAVYSPGLAELVLEEHGRAGSVVQRLTEREADVLRLVVEGLTGRQIATRLVLSPRTVENHVQHTLRKVGVPNRAALVRYAIENGLA
ncbi:MAG: response regulator transcription factor [Pseudonocardia sp.]|nr:response regulator transcription factor [Pseudonocardia sp.]